MSPSAPSTPGRFITLEGGEGVGKSTLAAGLVAALRTEGREVVQTREPGGASGADLIRALLVRADAPAWSAIEETLLFTAARANHVRETIAPALARGAWVVCDRYVDSTRAYQSAAGDVDAATVTALTEIIGAPAPDLTIILDLDPADGLARSRGAAAGEDRFERKSAAFHTRVREAFLAIAKAEPQRCVVIPSGAAKDDVLAAALAAIAERLS